MILLASTSLQRPRPSLELNPLVPSNYFLFSLFPSHFLSSRSPNALLLSLSLLPASSYSCVARPQSRIGLARKRKVILFLWQRFIWLQLTKEEQIKERRSKWRNQRNRKKKCKEKEQINFQGIKEKGQGYDIRRDSHRQNKQAAREGKCHAFGGPLPRYKLKMTACAIEACAKPNLRSSLKQLCYGSWMQWKNNKQEQCGLWRTGALWPVNCGNSELWGWKLCGSWSPKQCWAWIVEAISTDNTRCLWVRNRRGSREKCSSIYQHSRTGPFRRMFFVALPLQRPFIGLFRNESGWEGSKIGG